MEGESERIGRFQGRTVSRRTAMQIAVASVVPATHLAGTPGALAAGQDDVIRQILAIPGTGRPLADIDLKRVGELCLKTQNRGAFRGQRVTFIGLNVANFHNNLLRPLATPWEEATGATIEWIDVPQAELFAQLLHVADGGDVPFDLLEGSGSWEGEILGKGLALEMPDWVKGQVDTSDYVDYLRAPVGTWNGTAYRVSIDGDCHTLIVRADVFADRDLAVAWAASGGKDAWGVPATWSQVQAVTKFLNGRSLDGKELYGMLDVCMPSDGLSWYFFASRAASYVKHPDDETWLFDPSSMKPYVNNPGFLRALQDIVDAIPFEPPGQTEADPLKALGQILAGTGSMCAWWGDIGTNVPSEDRPTILGRLGFRLLPGSADVYNNRTGRWDAVPGGNVAPNLANLGWGLYVTKQSKERGVDAAAWDLAAHLGGKEISTWMAIYPTGFQPYRKSHFDADYWMTADLPESFVRSYLEAQRASYLHPNRVVEPRIPGIIQYYSAAELELAKAYAGSAQPRAALDAIAAEWEKITDKLGRDQQVAFYRAALGL